MTSTNVFEEATKKAEYVSFKEAVEKSATDSRLVIKDGILIVGKTKVPVPSFTSIDTLKTILEQERRKLYIELQDLYDIIIISDNPEKHRTKYEDTITKIETIDNTLDQAVEFVTTKNSEIVEKPIANIEHRIQSNKEHSEDIMRTIMDDIHLSKNRVQKALKLHHENMDLYQKLTDAKSAVELRHVIYQYLNTTNDAINTKSTNPLSNTKKKRAKDILVGGKLDNTQKAIIKEAVKKLMLGKLFTP